MIEAINKRRFSQVEKLGANTSCSLFWLRFSLLVSVQINNMHACVHRLMVSWKIEICIEIMEHYEGNYYD